MRPFALHITWTCYGTWLPGDPRGHVSNVLLPHDHYIPKQNIPGTPCAGGDEEMRNRAKKLMKGETVWLAAPEALCVAVTLVKAAIARQWHIARAAVMANHVHAVVVNCPDDGPAVRRILKGVSQAALNDLDGINGVDGPPVAAIGTSTTTMRLRRRSNMSRIRRTSSRK